MKIAVAGTGYVGLSLAILLSQHNEVHALDIVPEKVAKINNYESPIQDDEIERFLAEAKAGERELDLHATLDVAEAYTGADYAVIATPTNYDSDRNFFDTSSVEAAIAAVRSVNPDAWIVIKSTIPVGYTAGLREKLGDSKIFFSPEFLRESKALYDNLHPSRIVASSCHASQNVSQTSRCWPSSQHVALQWPCLIYPSSPLGLRWKSWAKREPVGSFGCTAQGKGRRPSKRSPGWVSARLTP